MENDPFSLEAQAQRIEAGMKPRSRPGVQRIENKYADALQKLELAEARLARQAKAWDKLRKKARYYERQLNKFMSEEKESENGG